ncbi:ATP-binding protein [Flavobacterium sp.]|uniref:tetratricopeptide repeat-containing hybrid sensor histidine kinase/response regulator n=1 Tax=Flavobacterium sp. TaxID=239 RepID=UPI0037C14BD7
MIKQFILFLAVFTSGGFAQSVYKEVAKITDSTDYYLEIGLFNKEEKKSVSNAILFTEKAIAFAKKNDQKSKLGNGYLQLATIYYDIDKNELSIDNYIRAINVSDKKNPTANLALAYYGLGKCYLKKNKIAVAEIYFEKASTLYESLNFSEAIELINLQKGIINKEKKQYAAASSILQSVIENLADNSFITTKIEAYFQLGEIEMAQEKYEKAINYYTLANTANATNKSDFSITKRILKQLSVAYEKTKNTKQSLVFLKKYTQLSDSIHSHLNFNASENMIDKIQFDEQLKKIEQLDKEKKSQQKTLRFSKLIFVLSIALISILSLLSFSLYKNNKIRNTSNKLLEEKNKELTFEKEKAEQASKARAEFLSTVSHELRTPLNAINGITYLLLQEKPKASQLNYLKSLEFSGSYLLHFINDILEINRLESDKIQVETINFNLKELIENITTSFKEFIHENNTKYHLQIDPTISDYLKGDPTKISQIVINLLNNAIKFSKNGAVWFTIKNVSEDEKHIKLHFEIKDNGIGIPKEKQETIFDSFSQGSVEINRTYGGTGLGLSIVKKILELMDSTIYLTSESGKGSTFSFELLFEKGQKSEAIIIPKTSITSGNKKVVLLVEDNKINQMITQKMLENKGISCVILDSGEEAIENTRTNQYDLILMDVHLPGISGTEATTAIRSFDSTTPIIALTAISLNENKETLLSFGMNEVITKPFEPDYFYDVILSYLATNE